MIAAIALVAALVGAGARGNTPTGCRVVYYNGGDGFFWSVNPDGSGAQRLDQLPDGGGALDWSRDGSRIAYADVYGFSILDSAGHVLRRIELAGDPLVSGVRWSPDGSTIAFSAEFGPPDRQNIYVVAADGTSVRKLSRDAGSDGAPSWSPDGRRIVFTRSNPDTGVGAIYVMNKDGSGLRKVPLRISDASGADWSPDGRRIAFDAGRSDWLFVATIDGTHVRKLRPREVAGPERPTGGTSPSPSVSIPRPTST